MRVNKLTDSRVERISSFTPASPSHTSHFHVNVTHLLGSFEMAKFCAESISDDQREMHAVHRDRQCLKMLFIGMCIGMICSLILWSQMGNERKKQSPHSFMLQHFAKHHNSSSPVKMSSEESPTSSFYSEFGISSERYSSLQQTLYWAGPDRSITNVSMSTSPAHSTFTIQNLKDSYQIGEELYVMIHARDFKNNIKPYGGDFFQAKLFSSKKASVFGEVVDLLNGSYSVRILLPWVGQAQVAVRLIHSSEAVQVLKHHRDTDSDRVSFFGYFEGPGPNGIKLKETVLCNMKSDKNGLERLKNGNCCCEYKDSRTGVEWRCQKPKSLPCSARVYHSFAEYINHVTAEEAMFLNPSNKGINGQKSTIMILPSNGSTSIDVREKCRPGLHSPVPSGFYLNDVWTSFVCKTRQFTTQTTTQCLKDKHIYMMGDSTVRQWFEFLLNAVPSRSSDSSGCGEQHRLTLESSRVLGVRRAVLDLLQRAPATTVIIKTVNTGFKDVFTSDWYSLQLDRILRWAFQDVGVYILDVWQMTSCHYNQENIHPGPVIIKNEIDILLSFICPE
ncbi:NXPE family member 3-like isoform X3 [Triplophysa dalaica]|uniref:NXPE family member 3-like isoform X3 n=1 Tax=Triplophysa dalaica TaxID=1582913 RepID=UPI0024DFF9DF|nr:NXPE family member 3-like isoform X3 [Triplophysa dalaica]